LELEPELAPVLLLLEDEDDLDMFVVSTKGLKSVLNSLQMMEE